MLDFKNNFMNADSHLNHRIKKQLEIGEPEMLCHLGTWQPRDMATLFLTSNR